MNLYKLYAFLMGLIVGAIIMIPIGWIFGIEGMNTLIIHFIVLIALIIACVDIVDNFHKIKKG